MTVEESLELGRNKFGGEASEFENLKKTFRIA